MLDQELERMERGTVLYRKRVRVAYRHRDTGKVYLDVGLYAVRLSRPLSAKGTVAASFKADNFKVRRVEP